MPGIWLTGVVPEDPVRPKRLVPHQNQPASDCTRWGLSFHIGLSH